MADHPPPPAHPDDQQLGKALKYWRERADPKQADPENADSDRVGLTSLELARCLLRSGFTPDPEINVRHLPGAAVEAIARLVAKELERIEAGEPYPFPDETIHGFLAACTEHCLPPECDFDLRLAMAGNIIGGSDI